MTATGNAVRVALISARLGGEKNHLTSGHVRQELPEGWILDTFFFNDENFPPRPSLSPRLQAKIPKMLGYELVPGYDFYIWIDSTFTLCDSQAVAWFVRCCADRDLVLFRHPHRASILQELEYILHLVQEGDAYLATRCQAEPLEEQVRLYLSDPDFQDRALYALGAFVYSKDLFASPAKNVMPLWFYHNARYSIRDQLSLPYLLSRLEGTGLRLGLFDEGIFDNRYLSFSWEHAQQITTSPAPIPVPA